MSSGEGEVVSRGCLVTKPSERKSNTQSLDGPAEVSAEKIQMDDPYRAYQSVSW